MIAYSKTGEINEVTGHLLVKIYNFCNSLFTFLTSVHPGAVSPFCNTEFITATSIQTDVVISSLKF